MLLAVFVIDNVHVALRKESVDRNAEAVPAMTKQARRSPQGERG